MNITCLQMDVLISFYLEGELSSALKEKVEEHLENCSACRAKFNIIRSLFSDLNSIVEEEKEEKTYPTRTYSSGQYRTFRNNLSAYVDNELPQEESIKIKKFTINNKDARKELEDTYHIRKLMNSSFTKTKSESKQDFSKKILKQLDMYDHKNLKFNPLIKVAFAFVMTVLILSAIIIFTLSF